MQFLYSLDKRPGQELEPALELFLAEGGVGMSEPDETKAYCRYLVCGTWARRPELDDILLRVLVGWRPERMVSVDRAILRMVIFEGFLERKVPFRLAVSEAVKIARVFGTDDSGRFVNGVLAHVVEQMIPEAERRKRKRPGKGHDDAAKNTAVPADG